MSHNEEKSKLEKFLSEINELKYDFNIVKTDIEEGLERLNELEEEIRLNSDKIHQMSITDSCYKMATILSDRLKENPTEEEKKTVKNIQDALAEMLKAINDDV